MELNYEISSAKEEFPVGNIEYYYPNEVIDYYSEKELIDEYKDCIYSQGINSCKININITENKQRHGLRYEVSRIVAGEYGNEYSKEEFEKSINNKVKNRKKELER